MLRLRRKHGRCDSDNLSLPSTDDEDAGNDGGVKKKNIQNSLSTHFSSSSEDEEDSEDSQEPYTMGSFPVENRTCIICHRVGCKDEHIKRKPKTVYTNPEEILEGACIFAAEEDDNVEWVPKILYAVDVEESSTNGPDMEIGDVYKARLMGIKEQLANEYAANDVEEEDCLFAEDIKTNSNSQSKETKNGDIISIISDSSIEEFSLEDMNKALPEVFSQIDRLYRDVVNEEAVLNIRPMKSPQWDDYMEGSFITELLSQWSFGAEIKKSDIEDYLEDSFLSFQLSQWNFGIDDGKYMTMNKFTFDGDRIHS